MRGAICFPAILTATYCLLNITGCGSSPWGSNLVSSKPIPYSANAEESLKLTYRCDAGKMSAPIAFTRIENQLVSHQQAASNPVPKKSTGKLLVTYPHPNGREGFALVGVVIESDVYKFQPTARDSWWWRFNAGKKEQPKAELMQVEKGVHEAWVLDIPKHEIDAVLLQMNGQLGSYQQKSTGEAELNLRWGKKKQKLRGETLTELDRLMVRVRGEGQLVSYHRPAMPSGTTATSSPYQHVQNLPTNALPATQPVSYDRARLGAKVTGFSAPLPKTATQQHAALAHKEPNYQPNHDQNARVVRLPEVRAENQSQTSPYMPSENRWPFSVPTPQLNQGQGTTWR